MASKGIPLDVTGEVVQTDGQLASLQLDESGMLHLQHKVMNTIVGQLVRAINAACVQVEKLAVDNEQNFESISALEAHLSSFEGRIRDCEDACQEVRLQLGTMSSGPAPGSPVERADSPEAVGTQALTSLLEQIAGIAERLDTAERLNKHDTEMYAGKFEKCDEMLRRHQDFFDDELESRLTQAEDDRVTIKAEVEALRQGLEDSNNRKAAKVELEELDKKFAELNEGHEQDHRMLTDARKQFVKLDGLTDLVNENKTRMQEMWKLFGQESQELREWASSGFNELRCAVRSKMEETDALSHLSQLRHEVRELAPYLSEALSRMDAGLRVKAEASTVVRLQDGLDQLERQSGRPKQLLIGTRCLGCDREVSTPGFTDQSIVSLHRDRQQADLFHEVQRALVHAHDESRQLEKPGSAPSDVLKYVAIHVGNPIKTRGSGGVGLFETRDQQDGSPGSHQIVRSPPGTAGMARRPHTHDSSRPAAAQGSARSPPREIPPLVRIVPRKPQPPPRITSGSYSAPATRDGQPRRPVPGQHTMRAALGAPPLPPTPSAPRAQPGAGQVHQQPSATGGVEWEGSWSSDNDDNRGEGPPGRRYLDHPEAFSEDSRVGSVASN
mmetsp:Transcript_102026/g.187036  ORF Transcript_102026/g.187036 Transcript_102026/m.187036 type:complete len:612 (-) Transcript_102026:73-1908(-)